MPILPTLQRNKVTIISSLCILFLALLTGCSSKSNEREAALVAKKNYLTEQDVLDIDPTREITEEEIQRAAKMANQRAFELAPGARVVLVQSGAVVPDTAMQQAMMRYYTVSVYTGVPPSKPRLVRRSEQQPAAPQPEANYIRSLRLAAAKAKQDKIIVYWGDLEFGKLDTINKRIVWYRYSGGKFPKETEYLRYLIRFALVDVKSGKWMMYSPANSENEFVHVSFSQNDNEINQIDILKNSAYRFAAADLSTRFERFKF